MKSFLTASLAGGALALCLASAPAIAMPRIDGASASQATHATGGLVEQAGYKKHWRSGHRRHWRHHHFRPRIHFGYPRYYSYYACGPKYRCWWNRRGYRVCGWVDRCY